MRNATILIIASAATAAVAAPITATNEVAPAILPFGSDIVVADVDAEYEREVGRMEQQIEMQKRRGVENNTEHLAKRSIGRCTIL
ncbi:hypothetical protein BDW02DRAFT_142202 [Decorospora gaudefroyi]|uniref:Uncharacterized protein n=1 Tax=Decorospora gaudefroyi TaxID=184978 RepID=A0A6A5KQ46_9PLEO|nr:hypothetical protein BDW02DRAFT_142202 [Decorospora gaudefroyi]